MIYKTYVPLYLSDTALFCFFAAMFFVVCFGAEVLRMIDFFRARYRRRNAVHAAELKLSFPTKEYVFDSGFVNGRTVSGGTDLFVFKVNLNDGRYRWTHSPVK